jgi:ribose/xylose/arabinose/galactoside ABC-type transport system permease subunit
MSALDSVGSAIGRRRATRPTTGLLQRHATAAPTYAALVILVLLLVGSHLYFGNFITPRNISSLLLDNAYLLIIAVGMTFVIMTGGIDLSVGSVLGFTGIFGARMLAADVPSAIVVVVILAFGATLGLCIGVLIHYFDVQPFVASLAGLFLARGLAFVVSLDSIRVDNTSILWMQSRRFSLGDWYITPTGILALLLVAVAAYVARSTRFGRTVYAIGGNESSAHLMGLDVARTKVLVYVICGTCSALGGLVLMAYSGAGYPRNGIGTELDVIAAVVIGGTLLSGGTGYIVGSMIGVFVYGTIKSAISFKGADQSWTKISVGLLLLAFIGAQRVIVVRSQRRSG